MEANIFALPSSTTDEYEYLTGEEILPQQGHARASPLGGGWGAPDPPSKNNFVVTRRPSKYYYNLSIKALNFHNRTYY